MQRRTLFKNIFLLGLGVAMPLRRLWAARDCSRIEKFPFHRFSLGELELTVVTDGYLHMSPVQPSFAPGIDSAVVNQLLRESFRPTDAIDLGMNILVIRKGERRILVDTGAGAGFGPKSGWLPRTLEDAGIRPENITDIVFSHAHPDHIGGLFRQDGSLVFPHAKLYLSALEYNFWTGDHPDFSHSKFPDKQQLSQMIADIRKTLVALRPRLHLFEDGDELLGCIRLELAAGHTPGHTLVHIFSGGRELVHIADLLHSDVLLFPHPEWGFFGDTDFNQAVATRHQVLARLVERGESVFAYHLAWPGLGHVRKKGATYEWVGETYAIPDPAKG
ncbi:MBL fold metallo-hydrolase [Chitinophaga pendula]|uniref:MBL fold metallo-hydrolase n=1 Tax=Chitinophaga TaxID=79328 RepID=UPI000BB02F22|nr:MULTISPECIES: MBL fold metallo-hydrolase [Chitinophaga]ASZ11600.1 MBL fold metallo-hydrolase [Chitinophaga sp. MD30]UCJ05390.1 MBL fold metallo-hydrolase [Chitinophaga pendula]